MLTLVYGKTLLWYVKLNWPELQAEIDKSNNIEEDVNIIQFLTNQADKIVRHRKFEQNFYTIYLVVICRALEQHVENT